MKITLELLRDYLGLSMNKIVNAPKEVQKYYQVVCYSKGHDYDSDFILLSEGEEFADTLSNRCLISLGLPSTKVLHNNTVLLLTKDMSKTELYMQIQNLILRFQRWEDELQYILKMQGGLSQKAILDQFFSKVSEMLENSAFLHDDNFFLLGNSQTGGELGLTTWNYDEIKGGYILPVDILNEFRFNKEYQETMSTHGACMFSEATFGYRIMYHNLWNNNRYRGRICINELDRDFYNSDFYLLELVAKMIEESFQSGNKSSYSQMYSLSNYFTALLDGEKVPNLSREDIFKQYGWVEGNSYFCCCLYAASEKMTDTTLRYYSSLFFREYPHSCSFPYAEALILIINCSLYPISIAEFRHSIGLMVREGLLKIGISQIHNSFTDFAYIYAQAKEAYYIGEKYHSSFWIHDFSAMSTEYIREVLSQKMPARFLCNTDLFLLQEYDKTHTSELFRTLQVYLENDRNLAKTAELMNIHRTTLLFRMRKISEIIQSDYTNPKDRFSLWFSYHLLDN